LRTPFGGVVLVGIEETADHPKHAERPSPLPRVHDLARRLRQAVFEKIDPPLPLLEAEGIALGGDEGVVVLRVPSSRRKPHRHTANNEVFVRWADELVRIGMREIQDLTIRAASEGSRVEEIIEERRITFSQRFGHWTNSHYHSLPPMAFIS
jgi:hypothetical protein